MYFGESPGGYTPEDEFSDLLAMRRQSQYDATVKYKKKKEMRVVRMCMVERWRI